MAIHTVDGQNPASDIYPLGCRFKKTRPSAIMCDLQFFLWGGGWINSKIGNQNRNWNDLGIKAF